MVRLDTIIWISTTFVGHLPASDFIFLLAIYCNFLEPQKNKENNRKKEKKDYTVILRYK